MLPLVKWQMRSLALGYRYVVDDGDGCELWTPDHMLIADFPAHLVLAILLQYLAHADTTAKLREALAAGERSRISLFPLASLRGLTPTADRAAPFRRKPLSEARPVTPTEKTALRITRRSRRR